MAQYTKGEFTDKYGEYGIKQKTAEEVKAENKKNEISPQNARRKLRKAMHEALKGIERFELALRRIGFK